MRHIWFIARTEIAHQLRRRETLVWTFAMPIVFFYFIGTVTGGFGSASSTEPTPLALQAPADAGFAVDELALRLEAQDFAVTRSASPEELERFTRRVLVPTPGSGRSFTEALVAGEAQKIRVESRAEGSAASFEQLRIQRAVYSLVADFALAAVDAGGSVDAEALRSVAELPRAVSLDVSSAGRRVGIPSGFEQTIPGTMVMFTMLVLLTGGAIQLVVEREQGLLRRLASTPISRTELVAGKWIGKLLLGLVQIAFAMIAGSVLFGMAWGAALPMVMLVLLTWAAFNASLGMLLGNLARSPAQMSGIGVVTTMVLAALGGCWWPIEVAPEWAQRFAMVLPTGWAMDAMHRLISFGDPAPAALPHALGLAAATVVLGAATVRTFRYQ
jgi:ABC-2 type transport system permease protein